MSRDTPSPSRAQLVAAVRALGAHARGETVPGKALDRAMALAERLGEGPLPLTRSQADALEVMDAECRRGGGETDCRTTAAHGNARASLSRLGLIESAPGSTCGYRLTDEGRAALARNRKSRKEVPGV